MTKWALPPPATTVSSRVAFNARITPFASTCPGAGPSSTSWEPAGSVDVTHRGGSLYSLSAYDPHVSDHDVDSAKRALRIAMRAARRDIANQPARSARICAHLRQIDAVRSAATVMMFRPVPGEPDLAELAAWSRSVGTVVVVPDPVPTAAFPIDPSLVDVALVPGVAFTADGRRLGQGGGWFDRFLAELRDDAIAIGVCFDPQMVDDLPTEAHDVRLDLVVTDAGVAGGGGSER